jgi:formamidopyrimidine-DNA glycosylase
MPEGPEVYRCGKQLKDLIPPGTFLTELRPTSGKLLREGIAGIEAFKPGKVANVTVKGKTIFIGMVDKTFMISSLGMAGWWYPSKERVVAYYGKQKVYVRGALVDIATVVEDSLKHSRLEIMSGDRAMASYVDPRNFGNFKVCTAEQANAAWEKLGHDALGVGVLDVGKLIDDMKDNRKIGEVLLDQEILCGYGNIYRAETLYFAGIDPRRPAKELSKEEIMRIVIQGAQVLKLALKYQGANMGPSILNKYEQLVRSVEFYPNAPTGPVAYGRAKDPFGNDIIQEQVGGRTIWWCPALQR